MDWKGKKFSSMVRVAEPNAMYTGPCYHERVCEP